MDVNKIKVGRQYPYVSRVNQGTGKVTGIDHKRTGAWVTLHDKVRNATVTVRPSQVGVQ